MSIIAGVYSVVCKQPLCEFIGGNAGFNNEGITAK